MTTVKFGKSDNRIVSVECDGHTGYGVEGEDIVCAALSSIVQTAVLGLMRVAGINVEYTVRQEEGYLKAVLPKNLSERQTYDADVILSTLLLGVSDLYEGFSDFINLEVK